MLNLVQTATARVVKAASRFFIPPQDLGLSGRYVIQHWREGIRINEYHFKNGITDVGKNHILDTEFHATAQITTWYHGLIDNSGFTALADADTMASHAGWNEFTSYSEANRVEWVEGAAAAKSISNPTPSDFTISGTGTVKGVFLVSDNTKGGTAGTLWGTALFATDVPVVASDVLKVTYTVNA